MSLHPRKNRNLIKTNTVQFSLYGVFVFIGERNEAHFEFEVAQFGADDCHRECVEDGTFFAEDGGVVNGSDERGI